MVNEYEARIILEECIQRDVAKLDEPKRNRHLNTLMEALDMVSK